VSVEEVAVRAALVPPCTVSLLNGESDDLYSVVAAKWVQKYTFGEFKEIVVVRLKYDNIDQATALRIADEVWNEFKSTDVRDAVKIGRLASKAEEVKEIINILKVHRKNTP
jgi:hypothetical protein